MKKLANIFMLMVVGFHFALLGSVNAADGWVESFFCDSSIGLEKFSSLKVDVMSPWDDSTREFHTNPMFDKFCVNTKTVGSLYDFNHDWVQADSTFCPRPYVTAKDGVTKVTGQYMKNESGATLVCCPPTAQNLVSDYRTFDPLSVSRCCKDPQKYRDINTCNDGSATQMPIEPLKAKLPSANFPSADTRYACPKSACLMIGANMAGKNLPRDNYTSYTKTLVNCVESIDASKLTPLPAPNAAGGNYCYNGQLYTQAEFTQWKGLLGAINTCKNFIDPNEVNTCLNCYTPCINQSECSITYSSLGCVDTTSDGLGTRVFQIGIGVVGVVGIIQVMNAALLRQSGDPAKIQESYEIIGSLLMGMVLLLGAIVILRFIGGPLLNIMPFDFLR